MKTEIFKNLIHRLVEIEPTRSPIISCFVNLDQPRAEALSEIESRARHVSKRLGGQRRVDFEDALDEVREYLEGAIREGSKSVAVYSRWGNHPVFLPLQFRVPLETQFIVDRLPHIYPLIELKDTYHRFVIVITTEDAVRILETTVGSVTEEILASRPELRERVGREWTREHYRNHKREREQQFIREKIRVIDELMSRRGHSYLIVAGSPRMTAAFTKALPARLHKRLLSSISANPKAGIDPILLRSVELFVEAENSESHDHVEKLESAILRNGLGVAGYQASKEALIGGYADLLIVEQAYADPEMREELVRLATASGVQIETVNCSETLRRLSGYGCLLRFRPDAIEARSVLETAA